MKNRRVRQLLIPLLQRRKDIFLIDHFLVLKPVQHVLRGIRFDLAEKSDQLSAIWEAHLLCSQLASPYFPHIDGFIRSRLRAESSILVGGSDDPAKSRAICAEIEEVVLPLLTGLATPEQLHRHIVKSERAEDWPHSPDPSLTFQLQLAMGCFEEARASIERYRPLWFRPDEAYMESTDLLSDRRSRVLCRLLEADAHAEIGTVLHDLERLSVQQFKVARQWEPTAFSFERDWF